MLYKLIILGCLGFFVWQISLAWRYGEIMGQGWWGRVRYYSRYAQPWGFYVTLLSYGLASLMALYVLLLI